ncbi:hypothetical protein [Rhodococcus rhodochrous]|uniref:hypothetical protein n=1 Tax=Rhodococcus rhodochrous TaxID=1829 RepID=UPI001781CC7A|nr:hypothetical protein [Rhodococcus rhodochrous]
MTSQSVSMLVRVHLSGRAPIRKTLPITQGEETEACVEPELELDPSYYERGTAARLRNHESLSGLDDAFDEIEQRADALLDDLMRVLKGLQNPAINTEKNPGGIMV